MYQASTRLRRLPIIGCAMLLCGSSLLYAQDTPGGKPSTESGKEYVQAVRTGRAPGIQRLQERLEQNVAAGLIQPIEDGTINDHQLPDHINKGGAGIGGRSGNDLVDLSSVIGVDAPLVDISVEGVSSDDNVALVGGRVTPPDTNGDVGQTHYVQYINLGWIVLNKSDGSVAAGPFAGNTFWQGFGGVCETLNAGDPIVLYDQMAGRWFFSQFTGTSVTDGHQCVAVSDGEDPTGPYTLYDFVVSPGGFNDYPHFGVWEDGYYLITHEFTNPGLSFTGVNLTVLDRQAILAGDPGAGFVQFTSPTSGDALEFGTLPANLEGPATPPSGTCGYLTHATDAEAFGVPGSDRIRFWEACIDFNTPSNSTLNQISSINIPSIDINLCGFSRDCIPQPGTSQRLDPNAANTMYRFNTRYFPGEGVLKGVVTRNVDVGGDRAGVFWAGVDINISSNATSISEGGDTIGVIDFNDGLNRWMGSASLDQDGNIGIGYTRGNASSFPSIYYTVHEVGVDPAGSVQTESVCVNGTGSTTTANRWADYASTSMDPVDNCTFWHTNEYVETTGSRQWNTRVCSFSIPSCGGTPPVNNPPNAAFTSNCTDLSCSFNASGSSDSDGSIVNYSWTFGDGNTGNGVNESNTYGTAGTYSVTLTVTDDDGATDSVTQNVTATDPPVSNCPAGSLNFNTFAVEAYSTQDNAGTGSVTSADAGDTLVMVGNRWQRSVSSFNVTANTVVAFEFASSSQGEIHGIGFDENANISDATRIFEFYGTQGWTGAFQFTPRYSGSGSFESITIPIGQTYTGNNFRLAFVNDKDAGTANNESRFRCVRVFEDTPSNTPPTASFTSNCTDLACSFNGSGSSDPDGSITNYSWNFGDGNTGSGVSPSNTYTTAGTYTVTLTVTDNDGATDSTTGSVTVTDPPVGNCPAGSINFNSSGVEAYSSQDNASTGSVTTADGGDTLVMVGNRWQRTLQSYTVTPNTVIEFDYASSSEGEIHGIGFDENTNISDATRIFQFFGTQNWGSANQFTPRYSGSGSFESFTIPVGQSYTGSNFRLAFVNDKDAGTPNNEGRFRCVRVFEDTPPPSTCTVETDFESGATGWSNDAAATCTTGAFVSDTPTQQVASGVITQPAGDNTTGSGNALFTATNTSIGNADVDGGTCILTSPVWNVTNASTLSAFYFHGQRDPGDDANDFFALELSTNGGSSFTPIVSIGDVENVAAWTEANAAIPAGSSVQLRMRVADAAGPGDIIEAGIDDVSICDN